MRKISELIKENDENKTFKYVANVKIEGTVTASSESDAGEAVDKEIDLIDGVIDYKMVSLDETTKQVKESVIIESVDENKMENIYETIIKTFEGSLETVNENYYKAMLRSKLEMYFSGK